MRVVRLRSLDEQMAFHKMNESSSRFTLGSSCNRSSKHDIGARKIIAFT